MRFVSEVEYCHDRLGEGFAAALSDYDTQRRIEVLVDDFLADAARPGAAVLDVGCGLGFFSESLIRRGTDVVACDLGPNLVAHTKSRVGCDAIVADALNLVEQFGRERFDIVVSSECIEHTPAPDEALRQMAGVLKEDGLLAVSTPNIVWQPIVRTATRMKFRPFDGFENFSSWTGLRRTLRACGIEIVREFGLHLIPFQFRLHRLSRWLDRHCQPLRWCMINLCVLGRKTPDHVNRNCRDNDSASSPANKGRAA